MLGTLARLALLRVLPKRLVPLLTVVEIVRFLRSRGKSDVDARSRRSGRFRGR